MDGQRVKDGGHSLYYVRLAKLRICLDSLIVPVLVSFLVAHKARNASKMNVSLKLNV